MKRGILIVTLMLLSTAVFAGTFAEDMASMDGHDWQRFDRSAKTVLMIGILYGIYYESIEECGFDRYGIGQMEPQRFHAFIQLIDLFYMDKDNRDILLIDAMRFIVRAKV